MIVSMKDQKVRPRPGKGAAMKFALPSFQLPLPAVWSKAAQAFSRLESGLESALRRSPVFSLPFVLSIPLFIVLLGITGPFWAPGRDFRLPITGLGFPEDAILPIFLTNLNDLESALREEGSLQAADRSEAKELPPTLRVQTYTVKSGDSISGVANQFGVSLSTVLNFNAITNVRRLQSGMELKVPNLDGILYTVKTGDSLSAISRRFEVDYDHILDVNSLESPVIRPGMQIFLPGASISQWELKQALGELFIYPARGRITSPYGKRNDPFTGVSRFHNGVDIANAPGTAVRASMDGRVSDVGFHSSYGNYVVLSHNGGYQTLYGHLMGFSVKRGDKVSQGQLVGQMGNTGYSTGTHVHFSIFRHNQHLDPMKFLN